MTMWNALKGISVCFTGFLDNERGDLCSKIIAMGGEAISSLSKPPVVLVGTSVLTEKYREAIKHKVTVVKKSWVLECWSECRTGNSFDPLKLLEKNLLPPLSSCIVCVTGVSSERRIEIEKLVKSHGGEYSPHLTKTCTHLIADNAQTKKYEYAIQWKVKTVNISWLYESIRLQACVSEEEYPAKGTKDIPLSLEDLDATINNANARDLRIFDGICCFVSSYIKEKEAAKLRKIMIFGGASSLNEYVAGKVTHVIAPKSGLPVKEWLSIKKSQPRPAVVLTDWIYDSYKERLLLSPNNYLLKNTSQLSNNESNSEKNIDVGTLALRKSRKSFGIHNFWDELEHTVKENIVPEVKHHSHLSAKFSGMLEDVLDVPFQSKLIKDDSLVSKDRAESRNKLQLDNITTRHIDFSPTIPSSFKDLTLYFDDTIQEKRKLFISEINMRGISLLELEDLDDFQSLVFIIVCNECNESKYSGRNRLLVTDTWLRRCLEDNIIYDPKSHLLYTPFRESVHIKEFEDFMIGVSGFDGHEREDIKILVNLLGGKYSDVFSCQFTHLICHSPSGLKYEKAIQWKIPSIKPEWLFDMAKRRCLIDYNPYLITNQKDLTKEEKNGSPKKSDSFKVASTKSPKQTDPPYSNSPFSFNPKTPNVKISVHDFLNSLETPKSSAIPSHNLVSGSTPFRMQLQLEESFAANIKRAAAGASLVSPSTNLNQGVDQGKEINKKEAGPSILSGVIVCISPRISHRNSEIFQLCTLLGAECLYSYNDSCTHYIHQGSRLVETFKDFKRAKLKGKYIVSPWWLIQCKELMKRLPEESFPHTYNPKRILEIDPPTSVDIILNEGNAQPLEPLKGNSPSLPTSSNSVSLSSPQKNVSSLSTLLDDLTPTTELRRIRAAALLRKQDLTDSIKPTIMKAQLLPIPLTMEESFSGVVYDDPESRIEKRKIMDILKLQKRIKLQDGEIEQHSEINFKDPSGSHNSSFIKEDAQNSVNPPLHVPFNSYIDENLGLTPINEVHNWQEKQHNSQEGDAINGSFQTEATEPICTRDLTATSTPQMERKRMPLEFKFLLSAFSVEQKSKLTNLIHQIGGTVLATDKWAPEATHLIAGYPTRSEKFLAAIASRTCILKESYLHASMNHGYFVSEEEHEWTTRDSLSSDHLALVHALWYWKKQSSQFPNGSFAGWKALLIVDNKKRSGYHRLLEAGGAKVVSLKPPFHIEHENLEEFTHCLIEVNSKNKSSLNFEILSANAIPILACQYIAEYLLNPEAKESDYFF